MFPLQVLDVTDYQLQENYDASHNGSCPRSFSDILPCNPNVLELKFNDSELHVNRTCPLYQRGCAAIVRLDVKRHMAQVAGVSLTISMLQIAGVIIAFFLVYKIRRTRTGSVT